jgi:diguanylate cyclase (GGDEF)-like protein
MVVGERVRAAMADEPFLLPSGRTITVTVSGGCASIIGADFERLVRDADTALYEAKHSGRNRIVAATGP